jgi:uncharacterized circularly permuted ATP-grasp superfamily protein
MLGTVLGMGTAVLWERAAELERAGAEEGAAALLAVPNAGAWHCDAIPYLLTEGEFNALAAGLAQRADVLELLLADLYGPRSLLERGHLPPALVYPSHAYLRALRSGTPVPEDAAPQRHVQLYAADVVRTADGSWCVLADRTGEPAGLAHVLENRRIMRSRRSARFSRSGKTACSAWCRRPPAIPALLCSRPATPIRAGSSMWCWPARSAAPWLKPAILRCATMRYG